MNKEQGPNLRKEYSDSQMKHEEVKKNDAQIKRKEPWYAGLLELFKNIGEVFFVFFQ